MSTAAEFKKFADPLAHVVDGDEEARDLVSDAWNKLPRSEQEIYRRAADRLPGRPGQPVIVECYVCGRLGTNGGHGDYETDKFTSAEQLAHYAQAMADSP